MPGDALLPCYRFHPAQAPPPISWFESKRYCLRLLNTGSALSIVNNEATFAFTHRCGPEARSPRYTGLCRWAPRSRSPLTPPSKLRGLQLLPRRDSHPIVITSLILDTHTDLTPRLDSRGASPFHEDARSVGQIVLNSLVLRKPEPAHSAHRLFPVIASGKSLSPVRIGMRKGRPPGRPTCEDEQVTELFRPASFV